MPFYVYILQNDATKRLYVGQTSNLEKRLEAHNSRTRDLKRYTMKQPGLWTMVYSEQYETRSAAMQRERQIKFWKNKKALLELISGQNRSGGC
jgi:putative endonuclease